MAGEFGLLRSWLLSLVKCDDRVEDSVTLPFGFELSHSLQIDLNSTKVQSFSLDLKFLRAHFSAKVWAFSQSERSSLNVESWCLKLSILSLKCATRLSVMSWSHLLLMKSIRSASDAVGHAGLTNLLRSDNLASKLFVTEPFNWLLAIAKWWMHWIVRNNVLTACAYSDLEKSSLGAQGSVDFNHVFSWPWFESCQNFD